MSTSICTQNFHEVSQSTAELLLLPVSANGRLPYWISTSGFDFDLFIVIDMTFFTGKPNFIQIGQRTMMSIMISCPFLQEGGHRVGNILPASVLVTALVSECRNLFARQISMRYLNLRLNYYYFRFLKNKMSPYWNSTPGLDPDLFVVSGMWFWVGLPNFVHPT